MGCGLLPPLQWSSATNQLTVTDLLPGQTVTLQVLALDAAGHVSAASGAARA
jgi:hypothetical protein